MARTKRPSNDPAVRGEAMQKLNRKSPISSSLDQKAHTSDSESKSTDSVDKTKEKSTYRKSEKFSRLRRNADCSSSSEYSEQTSTEEESDAGTKGTEYPSNALVEMEAEEGEYESESQTEETSRGSQFRVTRSGKENKNEESISSGPLPKNSASYNEMSLNSTLEGSWKGSLGKAVRQHVSPKSTGKLQETPHKLDHLYFRIVHDKLKVEKRKKERKGPIYKCQVCNRSFIQLTQYETHLLGGKHKKVVERKARESQTFECAVCHRKFKDQNDLDSHSLSHVKKKKASLNTGKEGERFESRKRPGSSKEHASMPPGHGKAPKRR